MGVLRVISSTDRSTVIEGDCREVMALADDNSFDAVITDPPYSLKFMGTEWDTHVDFQKWCTEWGIEALRVLKPGGHLFAFGGTRTWHRLASGLEDAGFEIRDSVAWLYSQGMPKSTASLKGSFEPIVVARKPFRGSQRANVAKWGTGALDTEAGRLGTGRWPPNVVLDEESAAVLDEQAGILTSGKAAAGGHRRNQPVRDRGIYGGGKGLWKGEGPQGELYGDSGYASRFYYVAKATSGERVTVDGVTHPTVKPLTLIRWLVRMGCPPGGRVLDMFAGSGTTGVACLLEGMSCVLIEKELPYIPLIVHRLGKVDPSP